MIVFALPGTEPFGRLAGQLAAASGAIETTGSALSSTKLAECGREHGHRAVSAQLLRRSAI